MHRLPDDLDVFGWSTIYGESGKRRRYHFQVLQAPKSFTGKNTTGNKKDHYNPMWKLMVSCIPMISRCWCTRNVCRPKGDVCLLCGWRSGQGQCAADTPGSPSSRSGCRDWPAVDDEWHAVEGSVSRGGMKGMVWLKKKKSTMPRAELEKSHTVQLWDHSSAVPLSFQGGKGRWTNKGVRNRRGKNPQCLSQEEF